MRQAFSLALVLTIVCLPRGSIGAGAARCPEVLEQARALLAGREYQKAATILEDALPGSSATERPGAMIALLRQSYRGLVEPGRSRRQDARGCGVPGDAGDPRARIGEHRHRRRARGPCRLHRPRPFRTRPASPGTGAGPESNLRRLPRAAETAGTAAVRRALRAPRARSHAALEGPGAAPRHPPRRRNRRPRKDSAAEAPSGGRCVPRSGGDRSRNRCRAPVPGRPTEEEKALNQADRLFTEKRYEEAGRIYARLAAQNQLPARRKQVWAYCRWVAVVARINARPRTEREWDEIEHEVSSIQQLTPGNWYGEYLQNRVAEARRGGRAGSRSGRLVVRGSAPEENPPADEAPRFLSGPDSAPDAPQARGIASHPANSRSAFPRCPARTRPAGAGRRGSGRRIGRQGQTPRRSPPRRTRRPKAPGRHRKHPATPARREAIPRSPWPGMSWRPRISASITRTPSWPRRRPGRRGRPHATGQAVGQLRSPDALVAPLRYLPLSDSPRFRPDDGAAGGLARLLHDGNQRQQDHRPPRQPAGRSSPAHRRDPPARGDPRRPGRPVHPAADPALGRRGHGRARGAAVGAARPRGRSLPPARGREGVQAQRADGDRLPQRRGLGAVLRAERLADPVPGGTGNSGAVHRVRPRGPAPGDRAVPPRGLPDRRASPSWRTAGRTSLAARRPRSPPRTATRPPGPTRRGGSRPILALTARSPARCLLQGPSQESLLDHGRGWRQAEPRRGLPGPGRSGPTRRDRRAPCPARSAAAPASSRRSRSASRSAGRVETTRAARIPCDRERSGPSAREPPSRLSPSRGPGQMPAHVPLDRPAGRGRRREARGRAASRATAPGRRSPRRGWRSWPPAPAVPPAREQTSASGSPWSRPRSASVSRIRRPSRAARHGASGPGRGRPGPAGSWGDDRLRAHRRSSSLIACSMLLEAAAAGAGGDGLPAREGVASTAVTRGTVQPSGSRARQPPDRQSNRSSRSCIAGDDALGLAGF